MSVRILEDLNEDKAVLWDSVTGRPFGLVIYGPLARDRAERFLDTLGEDPRKMWAPELDRRIHEFMQAEERREEEGIR